MEFHEQNQTTMLQKLKQFFTINLYYINMAKNPIFGYRFDDFANFF